MALDVTDHIDEACLGYLGHTNWGFADSSTLKRIKANNEQEVEMVVVFYKQEEKDG